MNLHEGHITITHPLGPLPGPGRQRGPGGRDITAHRRPGRIREGQHVTRWSRAHHGGGGRAAAGVAEPAAGAGGDPH